MTNKKLVDVIFASEKRKNVLLMLKNGPQEMTYLLESLDTNRPALLPQMRILEEHSLIYQTGDSYGLSTIGKIVVDEMKPFLDTIETLSKHSHYLSTHNTESIPDHLFERISEIRNCKIIEPSLVNTYEINKEFFEKAKTTKSLKFVFTFMHPTFPDILSHYTAKNIDITMIITQDLFNKMQNDFSDEFKNALNNENNKFFIYRKELNISSLSINDDCFVLRLLFNNNEFSSKQVYCCSPEAYRWSKDLFDYYLEDAKPINHV
ncbi:helix-turn-helix transcriptional regulator [Methanolobus bombayensis]|uniref:helix-turn-helix transcriptional regulator n=1 Tax=Methanolobus bombayensis TaxID=38023 RepID=UPI001FD7E40C|nr:winged helix-turn-helix domain-containing protein [Methanolobus bombayensis]MBP1908475.1 putative transcriptional regulator [Methanolobus bombayensis]